MVGGGGGGGRGRSLSERSYTLSGDGLFILIG